MPKTPRGVLVVQYLWIGQPLEISMLVLLSKRVAISFLLAKLIGYLIHVLEIGHW